MVSLFLFTDNGGEFTSSEFYLFCKKNGIKRELSCANTPQQNGTAERKIRHLIETCKSWLHAKHLPNELWAACMDCAAYVINRMPLSPNNMRSPYELIFKSKPNVKHFKVFGSICYVHIPDSQRSKLDAKAKKCIFIGYDERKKGWRCMDPETHSFTVSRDVVFDEISLLYGQDKVGNQESESSVFPSISSVDKPRQEHVMEHGERGSLSPNNNEDQVEEDSQVAEDSQVRDGNQRPRRQIVKPARFRDENFVSTYSCFFAGPIDDEEPICF